MLVGLPLGIAMARNDSVAAFVRPVLDLMQTMPAFVYLIPAAMFFGLGAVPGAIAHSHLLDATGCSPDQSRHPPGGRRVHRAEQCLRLHGDAASVRVQLPNALPSIMAGINQTIMLSLSMVVIASMIGASGIGNRSLDGHPAP